MPLRPYRVAGLADAYRHVAHPVGAVHARACGQQRLDRRLCRVPVVVPLPDAHDARRRPKHAEDLGIHARLAAVVRDFEHVHLFEPASIYEPVVDRTFGVTGQQCREAASLDPQHDAAVVHIVDPGIRIRPEHLDIAVTDLQVLARSHRARSLSGENARDPGHVTELPGRLLGYVHGPDSARPAQARQAADVVCMRMGEQHRFETLHAVTRHRCAQHVRILARVDQQRVWAVANKDRISLSHIQHDQGTPPRKRHADERQKYRDDRSGGHRSGRAPTRARPQCPRENSGNRHARAHRQGNPLGRCNRSRNVRKAGRDRQTEFENPRRKAEHACSEPRRDRDPHRPHAPDPQRRRHERHAHHVRYRPNHGQRSERGRHEGRARGARHAGDCHRCRQRHCLPRKRCCHPLLGKRREGDQRGHSGHRQREPHRERQCRGHDQDQHDCPAQRAERIGPAVR